VTAGTTGYGQAADVLAQQYESVTFTEVHAEALHLFPTEPSRILDIGAGSGRDAAALAKLGHQVVAAEPTPELRAHGQHLHSPLKIEWVADGLPDLEIVHRRGLKFALILLTAVWMHLDQQERPQAMESIVNLLAPEGTVIMTLRHGPLPEGRHMFDISAAETIAMAERFGLHVVHHSARPDLHGRPNVHMSVLGLCRKPARVDHS
jgi:SAM-dependent methyltransferase